MGMAIMSIGKQMFSEALARGLGLPPGTQVLEVSWDVRQPAAFDVLLQHDDLPEVTPHEHVQHIPEITHKWGD